MKALSIGHLCQDHWEAESDRLWWLAVEGVPPWPWAMADFESLTMPMLMQASPPTRLHLVAPMLQLFAVHIAVMANLLVRISAVLSSKQSEIASLKQQLAEALANDAADAAAIQAAKADASAAEAQAKEAQDNAARLQELVDADVVEDQGISDLLASFETNDKPADDSAPAPTPVG